MRLEHRVVVGAPRDRAWALLLDVPALARCVPGAEDVTAAGTDRYRGILRISVGPVRLRLAGEVAVTERDEAAGAATLSVEAADRAVGGHVRAEVRVRLAALADATEVLLTTDATLAGRIGDLGQPLIKRQADRMIAELARCLERALTSAA